VWQWKAAVVPINVADSVTLFDVPEQVAPILCSHGVRSCSVLQLLSLSLSLSSSCCDAGARSLYQLTGVCVCVCVCVCVLWPGNPWIILLERSLTPMHHPADGPWCYCNAQTELCCGKFGCWPHSLEVRPACVDTHSRESTPLPPGTERETESE